jgi:hypothetical protein
VSHCSPWQISRENRDKAASANALAATRLLNTLTLQLQSNLKEIATYNSTNAAIAAGANGTDIPTTTGLAPAGQTAPSFGDFASSLLCSNGAKLANCSGINPCKTKRCGPVSMCLVDQCGGCNARCIGYTEIGSGVNKLLSVVGMKPLLPGELPG